MMRARMMSIVFFVLFVVLSFSLGFECLEKVLDRSEDSVISGPHRKLLRHAMVEPNRIWGVKCIKSDIVVTQAPTGPLSNGIPTYTVEITNVCSYGCNISGIHLTCGRFGSTRLINPKIFKRLRYNDCLVNNGKALANGRTLSFQYANTFAYQLSVASIRC